MPNSENWLADFRGAFFELSKAENWEKYGALTSEEMADEWRAIFFEFLEGTCSMIPTGTIWGWGGNVSPDGWLLCDGQALDRVAFADLFAITGIRFGAGDGSTTFNLPDARGRVVVGRDSSQSEFEFLGEIGGDKTHELLLSELPAHNHTQDSHNHTQNSHNHTQDSHNHTQNSHNHAVFGDLFVASGTAQRKLNAASGGADVNTGSATATNQAATATNQAATATNQAATATNQASGGGLPHNNMPPFLVCNYIIKY